MSRAMWKAKLRIGSEALDVKLYAAVQERALRFHLLDAKTLTRVKQRMVHPGSGETVDEADVRRAVEVERGKFVVLASDEIARLDPEPSREIVVERCVPEGSLDRRFYERPYWLGPDAGAGERYFALCDALESSEREGLARWTMRGREYAGVLRVTQGHLALITLRNAAEVVPLAKLEAPEGRKIDERERKLATQLVAALAGEFDPTQFREEYRERVLAMIEAKRRGKRPAIKHFKPRRVDDASLAAALQRSLREAA